MISFKENFKDIMDYWWSGGDLDTFYEYTMKIIDGINKEELKIILPASYICYLKDRYDLGEMEEDVHNRLLKEFLDKQEKTNEHISPSY